MIQTWLRSLLLGSSAVAPATPTPSPSPTNGMIDVVASWLLGFVTSPCVLNALAHIGVGLVFFNAPAIVGVARFEPVVRKFFMFTGMTFLSSATLLLSNGARLANFARTATIYAPWTMAATTLGWSFGLALRRSWVNNGRKGKPE